jgi:hypothetical protein
MAESRLDWIQLPLIGRLEWRAGTTGSNPAPGNEKAHAKMGGRAFRPIGPEWEQNRCIRPGSDQLEKEAENGLSIRIAFL